MTTDALRIARTLPTEADTLALGNALARGLQLEKICGLTVYLHGDLGAGKTTLVRGILRGLGFTGRVKSPTFALLEPYEVSSLYLYHFDLYRFEHSSEWADSGFREYFNERSVCMVEWPEKAGGNLPAPDVEIYLTILGDGPIFERKAELVAHTEAGKHCLEVLDKS